MAIPKSWQAIAYNQVPHSQNQIHGDEISKRLGYTGALVPGVAQSAYLVHPAIEAWGERWLREGLSKVVVKNPLYDGVPFTVVVDNASDTRYEAKLINESGVCCAEINASLQPNAANTAQILGDPVLDGEPQLLATRENMQLLLNNGMHALKRQWSREHEMACYLTDAQGMPKLLRFNDGAGKANASFILGLADWVLAGNAEMNPWIHLQTSCQNYQEIDEGDSLLVEAIVEDLYNKKGHEFVDISAKVFKQSDKSLCNIIQLRAIYSLRGS